LDLGPATHTGRDVIAAVMIVADAVGCAYFAAFIAVNLRSATPHHEITVLYMVTILSTVVFELFSSTQAPSAQAQSCISSGR